MSQGTGQALRVGMIDSGSLKISYRSNHDFPRLASSAILPTWSPLRVNQQVG